MSVTVTVVAVLLCVLLAPATVPVWSLVVSRRRELRRPPGPHGPARYFDLRAHAWQAAPAPVHDWQVGGASPDGWRRGPARVAEILAVLDGDTSGDAGGRDTRLRSRFRTARRRVRRRRRRPGR
ncbi:hypothetical protein [Streptomyces sp. AD55]|uniref:hypothetical protein n=1 Tax=Streptomyces sp. AD55 TaxID=3242895 RepID=UPI003526C595